MNFGKAIKALRKGKSVTRTSWSMGKYLFIPDPSIADSLTDTDLRFNDAWVEESICMKNDGMITIGWTPNQEDMFEYDWITIEQEEN